MSAVRLCLRRLSLIAFLAVFGFALAPTLSHALAAANPWADICSTADEGKAPAPATGSVHLAHCPLCALGAGPVALPAAAPATFVPHNGADPRPAPFLRAPRPLLARTAAQPRAPPSQA